MSDTCKPNPMRLVSHLPQYVVPTVEEVEPPTITIMSRCHEYQGEWEPERDSVLGWWLRQIPKDRVKIKEQRIDYQRRIRHRGKRYHWRDAIDCAVLRNPNVRVDYDHKLSGAEFIKVLPHDRCKRCNEIFEQS